MEDAIAENLEEIFSVQIDSIDPNNLGAQIGAIPSATVTIVDDDGQPHFYSLSNMLATVVSSTPSEARII